jgi:hypothetical protein
LVVVFFVVLGVQVASPVRQELDSFRATAVAQQLVRHGTFSLEGTDLHNSIWLTTVHGHPYSTYPPGESVLAVPFVAGANLVGFQLPEKDCCPVADSRNVDDQTLQVVIASTVVAATAVLVFLIAELGLAGLDERRKRAWATGTALVFAFGTSAWSTASRSLWQHGPVMLCLAVAAYLALRSRKEPRFAAWMGIPLGIAYWMRPTAAIAIAVLTLWVLVCRRRQLPGYLLLLGAPLVALAGFSEVTFGALLPPYYSASNLAEFTHWPGMAPLGELVSPSRGLFVFAPVTLMALVGVVLAVRHRRLDGLGVALMAIILVHWWTVASFTPWFGGYSYGPRYMTDVLPVLVVLALPAVRWTANSVGPTRTAAMSGLGALVTAGVLFNFGGAWSASSMLWNADRPLTSQRLWSWSDPQFLRGISWTFPHGNYTPLLALLLCAAVLVSFVFSVKALASR